MALDARVVGSVLVAIAGAAGLAGGYVRWTPEVECSIELADAKARLELLVEAKDACKDALGACAGRTP